MTTGRVFTKTYVEPPYDKREILRYIGMKAEDDTVAALLNDCFKEMQGKCAFRVCYALFPCKTHGDCVDLGFCKTQSKTVKTRLQGADFALVFAATVGLEIDRLIARYGEIAPSKALLFQAIGTERVESLCDVFLSDIKLQMQGACTSLTTRFSPGYGDFSLEAQTDIFAALQPQKHIGVTLTDRLLMSPSKSVSAIVGMGKDFAKD